MVGSARYVDVMLSQMLFFLIRPVEAMRAENGLVVQGCVAQVSIKDELDPDLDLGKDLKDRC